MPEAVRTPVPASNFSVGNRGRGAVVLHLTAGSAASARARFQNPDQEVSSHFLALRDGTIWQFVSVLDTAYANGLSWNAAQKCWVDPEKNLLKARPPTWTGLQPPINPNWYTISVERELASTAEIPPTPQNAAVVRILQFVHSLFPTLLPSWVPLHTLIGHCHISPIARANCPGPKCDFAAFAAAANGVATFPTLFLTNKATTICQDSAATVPIGQAVKGTLLLIDTARYPQPTGHISKTSPNFADLGFVLLADLDVVK